VREELVVHEFGGVDETQVAVSFAVFSGELLHHLQTLGATRCIANDG
jgi:hypothetical protein